MGFQFDLQNSIVLPEKWKEIVKNYEVLQKFNQNLLMITWKIVGPHIKPWIPNGYYPEFEETYEVHW